MSLKSYALQMNYTVSDGEKREAEILLESLDHFQKEMDTCQTFFDKMYLAFKENPAMTGEQVYKERALLRKFRDDVAANFDNLKRIAFISFAKMQRFQSDTQMSKLINSFVGGMEELENAVNEFIKLFENLKSNTFGSDVVKCGDEIKKVSEELILIVDERVRTFVIKDILARNWTDTVDPSLHEIVKKKVPLFQQLNDERVKKK